MGNPRYSRGFEVTLHRDLIDLPLRWQQPRLIFVNSMSDLFHEDVPLEFIKSVFLTMNRAYRHTFQILTKRADRLAQLAPQLTWPGNVWMGVTVENQDSASRVDELRKVPSAVRFLSCEPLIGPAVLDLKGIDWVIVGGESGPGARPMELEWARSLRTQCSAASVPFFLKQLGGVVDKRGREKAVLDGVRWKGTPIPKAPSSAAASAVRT